MYTTARVEETFPFGMSNLAEVIPPDDVESLSAEHAGIWLGVVATEDSAVIDHDVLDAVHRLRAATYIDELEWLPTTQQDEMGRETDGHDQHSAHVAVVDARGEQALDPFTFATLRYIHLTNGADALPIEEEFGVVPPSKDEPRIEMSRFISRHPDRTIQSLGSISLVSHTVGTLNREGLTGYAIIEKPLLRRLRSMGMSIETITEPIALESYGNTVNYGVRIDGQQSLVDAHARAQAKPEFPFARFFDIATHGTNMDLIEEVMEHLGVNEAQKVGAA